MDQDREYVCMSSDEAVMLLTRLCVGDDALLYALTDTVEVALATSEQARKLGCADGHMATMLYLRHRSGVILAVYVPPEALSRMMELHPELPWRQSSYLPAALEEMHPMQVVRGGVA